MNTRQDYLDITEKTLSALVITFNEEANISRTLRSISWVPYVLVLDSGSTDNTLKIVSSFGNVHIAYRQFDSFANQCNYGLSCLTSKWILSLDADFVLTEGITHEIIDLLTCHTDSIQARLDGYSIRFGYCVNGKKIRSGLYPERTCLYRRSAAKYLDEGHGHRVSVEGRVGRLRNIILHDDRKPLDIWLMNQRKYQAIEARELIKQKFSKLTFQDWIRKYTCLAPVMALILSYIIKGGFLDGSEGIVYAYQRFIAEALLYLNIQLFDDRT